MSSNWYRITWPSGQQFLHNVSQRELSLYRLPQDCTIEEVQVLTQEELSHLITSAYQAGAKQTKELLGIPT